MRATAAEPAKEASAGAWALGVAAETPKDERPATPRWDAAGAVKAVANPTHAKAAADAARQAAILDCIPPAGLRRDGGRLEGARKRA
mmetsp:Transcript_58583/g.153394  ORF Transcript_58583/g.153394 Transcript_58583/m.153394 type:complete len:87 (+) Transcript_58583:254-514(+)